MSKLGIMDIVALAKAGYKASEVKELMQIEVPDKKTDEAPAETSVDVAASEDKTEEQKVQEQVPEKDSIQTSDPKESAIDYKAKYEEAEDTIKRLQQLNTRKNIQPDIPTDPLSGIDDFLKSIM